MEKLAEFEPTGERWRLRYTRTFPHPPEKVWRAMTEPEHLAAWFPSSIQGERSEGAQLTFVFPNGEAPTMEGRMLAYDPPRLLEYTWGEDTLRFQLRVEGRRTVLTFTDTIREGGKAARDGAGWHVSLDALERQLGGEPEPRKALDRWSALNQRYQDALVLTRRRLARRDSGRAAQEPLGKDATEHQFTRSALADHATMTQR